MSREGDMLIRIHNLMWENLWLVVSMSFANLLKRRESMKFKVLTEGGREFTVKAPDVTSAEFVAKTCLKKGESIEGIEEVKEAENVKEEEKKEESEGKGEGPGEEPEKEAPKEEEEAA